MATINGYTAEHMQEIEDNTIVDADLVGNNLVFTKHDASTVNVGSVRGPTGPTGPTGPAGTGLVICTSGTRPTPVVGLNIYETNTGKHLVYYGATTGWRPPWSQPWGYVASTVTPPSTAQTVSVTTSTKITGTDSETCSLFSNRRYRATCVSSYSKITAANFTYLQLATSASVGIGASWTFNMGIGAAELVVWVTTFTGTTYTGTLQLQAQTLSAGIIINNNNIGSRLLVEDIGPATEVPSA